MTRVAGVLLVLVLGALPPIALAPSAEAAGDAAQRYGERAFQVSNNVRARHGRTRLRHDRCLQRAAARHASSMRTQRRMFHQPLGPLLRGCGLRGVGENVAVGYPTGRAVVRRGWMRSPGHRRNLLRREYRVLAVAARRTPSGAWYACQLLGRRA